MSDSETAAATAQEGLDAPSTEEAPVAQVQVEEEEVAYDEEPDEEQQADGIAPASSAEAHNEVMSTCSCSPPSGVLVSASGTTRGLRRVLRGH